MFDCPFCMGLHNDTVKECPVKNVQIPSAYTSDLKKGVPIIHIFTIGYSGHGKTCFFSSFFHTLYHGEISKAWPGFAFMGLNMDTLNKIHDGYVNPLGQGQLPAKTPIMFPTPLILKFHNMPLRFNGLRRLFFARPTMQRDVIFIFYDIGGGVFEVPEKIKDNLPIINKVNTLLFLIDLPSLITQAETGDSVVMSMHELLNKACLAMGAEQLGRKKLVIGFTKTDLMWGKEDTYGPLSKKISQTIPPVGEIQDYLDTLRSHSRSIEGYLLERYPAFYNLCKNFNSVCCVSLSALGSTPKDDVKINKLAPSHVMDPILWTLKLEKYL